MKHWKNIACAGALLLAVACSQPTWEDLNEAAKQAHADGDLKQAEARFRDAVDAAAAGEDADVRIVSLNNLAEFLKITGRLPEALPFYQQAYDLQAQRLEAGPRLAKNLGNLADHYRAGGDLPGAIERFQASIDMVRETVGDQDETFADLLINLGAVQYLAEDNAGAIDSWNQAAEHIRTHRLVNHPSLGTVLTNLAQAHVRSDDPVTAEGQFRAALNVWGQSVGRNSIRYARGQANLAQLLAEQERYEEAESLYLTALNTLQDKVDADRSEPADLMNNLAVLYRRQGRRTDAESYYQLALERLEATVGPTHPATGSTLFNLGRLLAESDRSDEAVDAFARAYQIYVGTRGSDDAETILVRDQYAAALKAAGRDDEAAALTGA